MYHPLSTHLSSIYLSCFQVMFMNVCVYICVYIYMYQSCIIYYLSHIYLSLIYLAFISLLINYHLSVFYLPIL